MFGASMIDRVSCQRNCTYVVVMLGFLVGNPWVSDQTQVQIELFLRTKFQTLFEKLNSLLLGLIKGDLLCHQ